MRKTPAQRIAVVGVYSLIFFAITDPTNLILVPIIAFIAFHTPFLNSFFKTRIVLFSAISVIIVILSYFKYWQELLSSNIPGWPAASHSIPIGISFYSFQAISYLIDVHRKELEPVSRFSVLFAFLSFFPQVIAGPIVRAKNLIPQLQSPRGSRNDRALEVGLVIITVGMFLKLVIADNIFSGLSGQNDMFVQPSKYSAFTLMIALFSYSIRIYIDFFSYSLIAFGIAQLCGITLPINFRRPYLAVNFSDFWRRWHISLSEWMRDYLYIPLGGNRVSNSRRKLNVLAVMTLGGLWHGDSLNFLAWGLWHGLLLMTPQIRSDNTKFLPVISGRIVTFVLVTLGWIFFVTPDLGVSVTYMTHMFSLATVAGEKSFSDIYPLSIGLMFAFSLLSCEWLIEKRFINLNVVKWTLAGRAVVVSFALVLISLFSANNHTAFVYLRF